ncbi:DUF192 domain-containing protein [Epibacterium sp. MM17-32]|uniref:DUF192 domain-containing protein n=1 Tax=Epibacterium sp. MM17-32 TaxID=2917734 RepID=UPI001EF74664|nr:DUF192 domain-containing protein [Epibacterium sp. MM17-32]
MIRGAITALGIALLTSGAARADRACAPDRVDLRGEWGQASFTVELAETPDARAQGLMHRAEMPPRAGMLFVYEHPQRVAFWMKNTLISLDMIFVGADGVVDHIHENAIPGDLTPIPGGDEVMVVLEVNAGVVAAYGISVGSQMRHEVFSSETAKWPC